MSLVVRSWRQWTVYFSNLTSCLSSTSLPTLFIQGVYLRRLLFASLWQNIETTEVGRARVQIEYFIYFEGITLKTNSVTSTTTTTAKWRRETPQTQGGPARDCVTKKLWEMIGYRASDGQDDLIAPS